MTRRIPATLVTSSRPQPYGFIVFILILLLALLASFILPSGVLAVDSQTVNYKVGAGDTLYLIAQWNHTTVETLVSLNNLTSTNLRVGQVLKVPVVKGASIGSYYLVKLGDTLFLIAQRFGTTANLLQSVNHLTSTNLLVNQKLVIPDSSLYIEHQVKAGDTLYLLGQAYSCSADKIKTLNHLGTDVLSVGQVLLVPRKASTPTSPPPQPSSSFGVLGFYTDQEGGIPSSSASTYGNIASIEWVSPFWYRLDPGDCTKIQKNSYVSDAEIKRLVSTAHSNQQKVLPIIYNFFYDQNSLTKDLVTWMISTPANRSACIANIIKLLQTYGFDGVNMDFEGVRVSDRANLAVFYRELGAQLHARGYFLSVDVPGKSNDSQWNDWTYPYDYQAIGQAADQVVLMMYNEHGYKGSGPGAVSSIPYNRANLKFALTKIAPQKIAVAVPVFGFDFNLNTGESLYVSYASAMKRASTYKATPVFDSASQTPYFSYTDSTGQKHQVWFENAASLKPKLDLVKQYNLGGIALWRLGMEDPQCWPVIRDWLSGK
ncbi:MAG: LysM peptidoglycan-binding domain-containing protein [Firmicutes bacterium]|nr:LysM peptidoglycan-binding domain-containing protein [Bacillota bacterium]